MAEIKTFKIEQKFKDIEDLYNYLLKNVNHIGETISTQIQKPMKAKPLCVIGKEKITERNILFFASKSDFPESLGELIVLASVFDADIIIFFLPEITKTYLRSISWLQKISNEDTKFMAGEVVF